MLMSNINNYGEIVYELKEKQGKYYCVIYADEERTALYRTGYFSSATAAVSRAKKFIDDYHGYRESKEDE
jgi:hypothetical protein